MQNKLQELTDRLYAEGLSKGKQEGEELVQKAKAEAEQIVNQAKAEAARIVAEASKQGQKNATSFTPLRTAYRRLRTHNQP